MTRLVSTILVISELSWVGNKKVLEKDIDADNYLKKIKILLHVALFILFEKIKNHISFQVLCLYPVLYFILWFLFDGLIS